MRQRQRFVAAGEQYLVFARDITSTAGMDADLVVRAGGFTLAAMDALVDVVADTLDVVEQRFRRPAGASRLAL
ncbi:MAG: hypothetical protein J07HN6_01295 [Halonotius sp. J07HN6]|nr:MAG: hypothetical protein J07HN6_01295 [Halonotius sp. J07HN6]